jgi:hypothetical protein
MQLPLVSTLPLKTSCLAGTAQNNAFVAQVTAAIARRPATRRPESAVAFGMAHITDAFAASAAVRAKDVASSETLIARASIGRPQPPGIWYQTVVKLTLNWL